MLSYYISPLFTENSSLHPFGFILKLPQIIKNMSSAFKLPWYVTLFTITEGKCLMWFYCLYISADLKIKLSSCWKLSSNLASIRFLFKFNSKIIYKEHYYNELALSIMPLFFKLLLFFYKHFFSFIFAIYSHHFSLYSL